MDDHTRGLLLDATQSCRTALEEEFSKQLEGTFDIFPDGRIEEEGGAQLSPSERLVREKIVTAIEHRQSQGEKPKDAVAGYLRECAFTFLNRLAALKMMEARDIVQECISKGEQSSGFKEFGGLAKGLVDLPDEGYRLYLESLFDEIGTEVGVLFDRRDPAALLWPQRQALKDVLEQLNDSGLRSAWGEDEAIGWLYQYFNSQKERDKMREKSVPQNSYELAVRNQFFTPRYVVAFLSDNTLGRIWYEMTEGQTELAQSCRYLIRRPHEIFMRPLEEHLSPDCRDWVTEVRQGNFAAAEFDATWEEMTAVALAIEGYTVAEQMGYGDVHDYVRERGDRAIEEGVVEEAPLIDQWLLLFSVQRGIIREGLYGRDEKYAIAARKVWEAWVIAARAESYDAISPEELAGLTMPLEGGLEEAHQRIYGEPLDQEIGVEGWIEKAWQGDLSELVPEFSVNNRLVAVAVPKTSFQQILGDPDFDPREDTRLTEVISSIAEGEPSRDAWNLPILWAALSDTIWNDGSGAYGAELWDKLWPHFCLVARINTAALQVRNLSKEEFLNRPTFIPPRPLKDPREIRWLDPACGSMHFGLYAFDLFEVIYREVWDRPGPISSELRDEFDGDADRFLREIPRMILEHNLHGVDIDPRAAQIAQLALWLRAQRSWNEQEVARSDRPKIVRSNVVCAEALPDESQFLAAFQEGLSSKAIGGLVTKVIKEMKLAGEAGSLLKIREKIRHIVHEAKEKWREGPKVEQALLFPEKKKAEVKQEEFPLDYTGITDETFWEHAEDEIYRTLREYAAEAGRAGKLGQRLFAEDVERGFALIDLLSKRFDVAVMNPPFGEFSKGYKPQARTDYPNSYNDILAAFVDRMLDLLNPGGRVGAITSRTGFFISSFEDWREKVLLQRCRVACLTDLGERVMDEATVEAAAYCLEKRAPQDRFPVFRLLGMNEREPGLVEAVQGISSGRDSERLFVPDQNDFDVLPGKPFTYWASRKTLGALSEPDTFEPEVAEVRVGLQTGNDPRFVRGVWEEPRNHEYFCYYPSDGSPFCSLDDPIVKAFLARSDYTIQRWAPHVKSGASQPWFSPITVVITWEDDGIQLRKFGGAVTRSTQYYFRPGFSWTRRAYRFVPYTVPTGCISTVSRYMAFPERGYEFKALSVAASNLSTAYMRFYGDKFQWPNFLVENLKSVPWVEPDGDWCERAEKLIQDEVAKRRGAYRTQEPFREFTLPPYFSDTDIKGALAYDPESLLGHELEVELAKSYGLDEAELADLERDMLEAIAANRGSSDEEDGEEKEDKDFLIDTSEAGILRGLISWLVGCAFGRWDIRFAKHPELAPDLGDVFDPLPVCEPACLVNPVGLPAQQGQIVSKEWLQARPNAITLPPDGEVSQETIADSEYPIDQIPWDGILTEDEGAKSDILDRIESALGWIEGDHPAAITLEKAATALKIGRSAEFSLRDYFRNPNGFFGDHVGAYTKSKRKAPLYWALATPSGSYTVWLYYFCCTGDTLFTVLRDHAKPKLKHEEGKLNRLKQDAGPTPAATEREDIDKQDAFVTELRAFCQELERVAPLWKPHFDDGVIINYAPLWRLVAHKPWQKECKAMWDKLVKEDLEWAHLAMHLWPERVVPKCQDDLSLAIAHGLEDEFWYQDEDDNDKWKKLEVEDDRVDELIEERSSAAVKAALEDLLSAPVPSGGRRRRRN